MKRKILSVTLALSMLLALVPTMAIADTYGDLSYSVNDDKTEVTIADCDENARGEIVIPETIHAIVGYDDENEPIYKDLPATSIDLYAFYGCKGLTSITIPDSITSIGEGAFYGCSRLTNITIPNSLTGIGNYAFYGCSGLTSITIPDSITSIGKNAFNGCSSLTNITIPNSVTSIGNMAFYGCSGLTSVTIPDSVTSIGECAFFNCSGLTSITIPDSVTSISGGVFSGCSGLTSITIPDSITSIGEGAFYGCSSLTNITIPNSVTSIGEGAFYECSGLTNINVKSGNKYYCSVDGNLFDKTKTKLIQYAMGKTDTSYTIPNSVTNIGEGAFYGCTGLTNITIPNGVTSIGEYTFSVCSSLTSITIPKSVTSIGEEAFEECTSLKSVYYGGTEEEWKKIPIASGNTYLTRATIYYNGIAPSPSPDASPSPTPTTEPTPTPEPLEVEVTTEIDEIENKAILTVTSLDEERAGELTEINLFVAEYDANGLLIGVHMGVKSEVVNGEITVTADLPTAEKYKFLLWDKIQSPLMNVIDDITSISEAVE